MRMRMVVPTIAVLLAVNCASADERPLRAGVDATFAPHAMPNLSGGVEGFNIDLGNGIARRLRRKLEIDATQFSGLVPGLQAGTYDPQGEAPTDNGRARERSQARAQL